MKYVVGLLIIAAIIAGVWWHKEKNERAIVASGHPEWTPIMYAKDGTIQGAGPELLAKIAADLKLEIAFPEKGTWDEVQAKAKSGEVDMLVAAYKTDERLTYMDYSDAYTTDPVAVFVKKGSAFPFGNNEDLVSKRGVAMTGDSYGQTFDDFSKEKLNLARVATNKEAFDKLTNGEADYFVYSLFAGEAYMREAGGEPQFEALPNYVDAPNFYITISKKSPFVKYMPKINELIAKYKADGTIDALIQKHKQ